MGIPDFDGLRRVDSPALLVRSTTSFASETTIFAGETTIFAGEPRQFPLFTTDLGGQGHLPHGQAQGSRQLDLADDLQKTYGWIPRWKSPVKLMII